MADRRKRPHRHDCRLISERTAKTLRMQVSPLHIYRPRQSHRITPSVRRNVPIMTEYGPLSMPDEIQPSSEEDEWNPSRNPVLEGTAVSSTDLDDAFLAGIHGDRHIFSDLPRGLNLYPRENPLDPAHDAAATVTSPRPVSPPVPSFTSSWANHSYLARQNSIHRRARSRTTDFSEFTQRRRSNIRVNQASEQPSSENSSNSLWTFRSSGGASRLEDLWIPPAAPASPVNARRFFPPIRLRHEAGSALPHLTRESDTENQADEPSWTTAPGSLDMWYDLAGVPDHVPSADPTSSTTRRSSTTELNSDRPRVLAPRLRRGGIRPPESLLSRFSSEERGRLLGMPSPSSSAPDTPQAEGSSTSAGDVQTVNPASLRRQTLDMPSTSFFPSQEETLQLLTPRSVSPAGESAL